jgi:membrane peptidoglycan carboxypeptidase
VAKEATKLSDAFAPSLRVRTTLVPKLQLLAEQVVNDALVREGRRAGVSQAALVALRPDGAVLAMVGGRDYHKSQFNRATEANRHPGSAFKLFVYLAALRNGFTPQDTIDARPVEIKRWRPENFDGREYGRVTLAEGFAQSINTAAVRLAMQVGLDQVIAAARDLGIDARLPAVPSLALGAVEISLLDLTGAFVSVRAGRTRVQPWGIAAVGEQDQSQLRSVDPAVASGRPLGPSQQPLIELLRLVVERGTGRAAALDGFAAGKTGTSQNHRDAWFIGFNEALVVGVWVGNDDGTPMHRVVGGALPATIWKRFMAEATRLLGQEGARVAEVRDNGLAQERSDEPRPAQCDYQACASEYRSFRPSDCTYQSYRGPRRLCEIGARTTRPHEEQASQVPADVRAQAQCNIDVCARFYSSFNPSDCSYQPYGGGPRKLCDR